MVDLGWGLFLASSGGGVSVSALVVVGRSAVECLGGRGWVSPSVKEAV
jgi:hypothetical protein